MTGALRKVIVRLEVPFFPVLRDICGWNDAVSIVC
jgi:hypothetical protein